MMPSSPAPVTAAPLQDAIGMLPLRSASPWKEGSLLLRTQDGKLFPFAPNSSEQAAWIDLGVAPMGGGKSVFLNALNFAFVTQAGLSRLPWVSIIDVGPSSSRPDYAFAGEFAGEQKASGGLPPPAHDGRFRHQPF